MYYIGRLTRMAGKLRKSSPKILPADYEALAQKCGLRWLGPPAPHVGAKTGWRCRKGHEWQAPYNTIQQGSSCPYCAGNARKTAKDYQALAKSRGYRWVGPMAPNVSAPTGWQCARKHHWRAPYRHLQQGSGCPTCGGNAPRTPADYRALAKKRGLRWLGPEAPNTSTPTGWVCRRGHRLNKKYNALEQMQGCPVCTGRARKTPEDYKALARKRSFRWLGPEVRTTQTKTSWRCSLGHKWQAPYHTIQREHGCPMCSGRARKTPADYQALARKRGFRWLGPEVRRTDIKTGWRCSLGHAWQAPYCRLQQGSGCPVCAGPSGIRTSRVTKPVVRRTLRTGSNRCVGRRS